MDSKKYLQSYGWKEGEALKHGGLKKPILVKHKKDNKGLGHSHGDGDAWWERVFDGQLKNLDVMSAGGISFKQNEVKVSGMAERDSPLYRMFVKGEGLAGTVGKKDQLELKAQAVVLKEVIQNSMMTTLEGVKIRKEARDKKKKKKDKKKRTDGKVKKDKKDTKAKKEGRKDKKSKKNKNKAHSAI